MNAHERERHQHTGVAAVGSAGGVFSLVRLPWAHNLTDFPPRRGRLEALRYIATTHEKQVPIFLGYDGRESFSLARY